MKIRGKLTGAIFIIVAGFVTALIVLIYSDKIVSDIKEIELKATKVVSEWYNLNSLTKDLLIAQTPVTELRERFNSAFNQFQTQFDELFSLSSIEFLEKESRNHLESTESMWNVLKGSFEMIQQALDKIVEGGLAERIDRRGTLSYLINETYRGTLSTQDYTVLNQLHSNVGAISNAVLDFTNFLNESIENISRQVSEYSRLSKIIPGGILALVTAFAVFFSLFFSKRIALRIGSIENTMQMVANRDFTVRSKTSSKDEIGALGNHINQVLDTVQDFLRATRRASGKVSELKETLSSGTTESASALDEISKNIENMKNQFSKLEQSIENTAKITEDIVERIAGLEKEIQKQSESVDNSSSSIEDRYRGKGNLKIHVRTGFSQQRDQGPHGGAG
ncbi:MAG: hypothetical protein DRP87_11470 [Spirochaetes bacterium]|nr:MAG: hypothetical protein DRP87_11470 [Spirochaetota bacterium]